MVAQRYGIAVRDITLYPFGGVAVLEKGSSPALPLDGGRVLRALLEMKLGWERATLIASGLAKVIAVAMGIWAILGGQLILGAIAVMVFFGARAEVVADQVRFGLAGRRAGDLFNRSPLALGPGDGIHKAVDLILSSPQRDFPVVLGNQLLGVLTREHVMAVLEAGASSESVAGVMARTFPRS